MDQVVGTLSTLRPRGVRASQPVTSLGDVLAVMRHRWALIAAVLAVFLACATAYVLTAPRYYTATTDLLIEPRPEDPLQKTRPASDAQIETTAIESQAQLLTSDAVVRAVVRQLGLAHDAEFMADDRFVLTRALDALVALVAGEPAAPRTEADIEQDAVDRLTDMIRAGRNGRTYVLGLSVVARDPQRAAQIANALAAAYGEDQLQFRLASIDRSADWLKSRAADLRRQSLDADQAVQAYRSANGIVDTQRGVVQEQQLGDLNLQLATARAQLAEKKARLDSATASVAAGVQNVTFAEALANPVIVKLRQQYLDDARRETEVRQRYGDDHPTVAALRAGMDELRRSMRDELDRIVASFRSDYDNALASQTGIEQSIARLVDQAGRANRERVELRALETTAQTYRTLFETFLQQYGTTLQQQSFPVLGARVITPAKAPRRKSHPRTTLILLGAAVLGLGAGWLIAFSRETLHPVVRGERAFEEATGLAPLGHLPDIAQRRWLFGRAARQTFRLEGLRLVGGRDALMQITRLYPHSWFASTISHVQRALDAVRPVQGARVVGVISAQRGDGKTIVSVNLAQHLARSGARTLLIDLDARDPDLTAATGCPPGGSLLEVLADEGRLGAATVVDDNSGLYFLPNGGVPHGHDPGAALLAPALHAFVARARGAYDYVILDLPPFDSVIEARGVSMVADTFVVVGACDRTRVNGLTASLDRWETAGVMPIVGFVLNRVRTRDPRRMQRAAITREGPGRPAPGRQAKLVPVR